MNTRDDARPALAAYLENLTIQLRLLEVPGNRIGQILAEIETHVADTGFDAVDAFGARGVCRNVRRRGRLNSWAWGVPRLVAYSGGGYSRRLRWRGHRFWGNGSGWISRSHPPIPRDVVRRPWRRLAGHERSLAAVEA